MGLFPTKVCETAGICLHLPEACSHLHMSVLKTLGIRIVPRFFVLFCFVFNLPWYFLNIFIYIDWLFRFDLIFALDEKANKTRGLMLSLMISVQVRKNIIV